MTSVDSQDVTGHTNTHLNPSTSTNADLNEIIKTIQKNVWHSTPVMNIIRRCNENYNDNYISVAKRFLIMNSLHKDLHELVVYLMWLTIIRSSKMYIQFYETNILKIQKHTNLITDLCKIIDSYCHNFTKQDCKFMTTIDNERNTLMSDCYLFSDISKYTQGLNNYYDHINTHSNLDVFQLRQYDARLKYSDFRKVILDPVIVRQFVFSKQPNFLGRVNNKL